MDPVFVSFGLPASVPAEGMDVSPNLLGGKGAGLIWMSSQGVPVPPGFVIPVSMWAEYDKKPKSTMKLIEKKLPAYLDQLREHFGYMPLLSVRSGSRVSCPGMMDTILNVGIDDQSQDEWLKRLGPECYADSLHRLVTMYGSVVKGLDRQELEKNLSTALAVYQTKTGGDFPNAMDQLLGAIEAVFKSWDNERADVYRKMNSIPREWGTAVTVQSMVFGNLNSMSGTGVLFTRNPDTGEAKVTGEFLQNAQGEDVVAGIRTPHPLHEMPFDLGVPVHTLLLETVKKLETLKKDVQDVEFTIQDGKLFILQTRNAKRSAAAAVKIALDMVTEQLLTPAEAVKRVTARQLDLARMTQVDPKWTKKPNFTGIPACSGVVTGKPVFTRKAAIDCKEPCILITQETTPDDIAGMKAAVGIITMVGGLTSHAAVVARSMDRACIVGLGADIAAFKQMKQVSMDGATGRIWDGAIKTIGGDNNAMVEQFEMMVCKEAGVVPVITKVPTIKLDSALLYLGAAIVNPEEAVKVIISSMSQVTHLYLDLTPAPGTAEAEYFKLLAGYNPQQQVLKLLQEAFPKEVLETVKQRLTVIANNVVHPFPSLGLGGDLRSIILSAGELALDGLDETDPAVKKVLAWKAQEGLNFVSLGKLVPGSKSVLSVSQVLQLKGGN